MIFYKRFSNVKIKIGKYPFAPILGKPFLSFRAPVQESIVHLFTLDLSDEKKYLHLLFPTNLSELNLFNKLLENYKQKKQNPSSLLKLTKKIFKSTTVENISTTIETFLQALVEHDDRENVLLPLLQQHDEILRLVEDYRPNWIKFAIIYVLLGIQIINKQVNNEFVQLSVIMVFKLLKKLLNEVNFEYFIFIDRIISYLDITNQG